MHHFLSTGGAARLLGNSREWVGQLVRAGRLPVAAVDSNGRALLRREDVERFKAQRLRRAQKRAKADRAAQQADRA